jgi:hypothetical protein
MLFLRFVYTQMHRKDFANAYSFSTLRSISCCPQADKILLELAAQYKRLGRPALKRDTAISVSTSLTSFRTFMVV